MHIPRILKNSSKTRVSFEIIPPKRGGTLEEHLSVVKDLAAYNPAFIDVTSHAAEEEVIETDDGIRRHVRRKRPGTLILCAMIQERFGIDAVPHVLCQGFTREETEDFLIDTRFAAIDNVLALQGDKKYSKATPQGKTNNTYASDLVSQIHDLNNGRYLIDIPHAKPTDFCVGVAAYPEKHFAAPNLETDIENLKKKVDAGASYIVTQMFFDNDKYFSFVDACQKKGISVPIIPGLKVLQSERQLVSLPSAFHLSFPYELTTKIQGASAQDVKKIGREWAVQQSQDLISQGVPDLHFYVLGKTAPTTQVLDQLTL